MNNYVYTIGNKLYINLTNKCSNNCNFCIRNGRKGMGDTELWIDDVPTADDIVAQLPDDLSQYDQEVVFCGFGEPTYNLDALEEVASYLHCVDKTTRINTNGQANLIHNRDVSDIIADSCDVVNVSLNCPDSASYQQVCHSIYGEKAFDAMLEFAKLCQKRGASVIMSVVDSIGNAQVEKCRKLCQTLDLPLRVREKE